MTGPERRRGWPPDRSLDGAGDDQGAGDQVPAGTGPDRHSRPSLPQGERETEMTSAEHTVVLPGARVPAGGPVSTERGSDAQQHGRPLSPPPTGEPRTSTTTGAEPIDRAAGEQDSVRRGAAVTGPRRARLTLTTIDPWSVLKFSLLLSMCLLVVALAAVFALWSVLDALGVFTSINDTVQSVSPTLSSADYLGLGKVMGATLFLGAVNVVLVTALATLGAFLYNLCAGLTGGLDVTFTEQS